MSVFDKARQNMVKCQLNTNGVMAPRVLEVFGTVPREQFIPADKQAAAYIDEDVRLDNQGSFLLEPLICARMVQALEPGAEDNVLNIGDVTGYSSAILSNLVSTVVALEQQPGALDQARAVWDRQGLCNIAVIKGDMERGSPEHAPYDLIFLNDAVAELPQTLLDQLAPGGRLVAVVKENNNPMGQIVLCKRLESGNIATRRLYDAATPYLKGFEPKPRFVF